MSFEKPLDVSEVIPEPENSPEVWEGYIRDLNEAELTAYIDCLGHPTYQITIPLSAVKSEELVNIDIGSRLQWTITPLDGTTPDGKPAVESDLTVFAPITLTQEEVDEALDEARARRLARALTKRQES